MEVVSEGMIARRDKESLFIQLYAFVRIVGCDELLHVRGGRASMIQRSTDFGQSHSAHETFPVYAAIRHVR